MRESAEPLPAFGGLPALANLLSRRPHPDEIVTCLVDGPLAPYSAFAGILLWCREPTLRMLGVHGYKDEELDGFDDIPLHADLPITRAVRDGELIIASGDRFEIDYTDERVVDAARWADMRARVRIGAIVSVPIISRGVPVGALGFTCHEEREWIPADLSLLETVSRMLAMWMQHPDSGIPWRRSTHDGISLTPRQCQILALVIGGKTNAAIGAYLGYSESTVKQELGRAMRMLGTTSREATAQRAASLHLCDGHRV